MLTTRGRTLFRMGEVASYGAGLALIGFFVSQFALGEARREADIHTFEQSAVVMAEASSGAPGTVDIVSEAFPEQFNTDDAGQPDTTLWAPQRVLDYQHSLQGDIPPVLGVLEVPSVGLKVPVYPSDSELNMDRGAGVIDGMAYPHEGGNIGIAGHRDGYFRVLKDVQVGDKVLLQTLEGPKQFTIDSTRIVEISDIAVLKDTIEQKVTLVTCYPFYFVGHAPQRYIVTASLDSPNVNQQ